MKETHIIGAVYRHPEKKELVLLCERATPDGYRWVSTGYMSSASRSHEVNLYHGFKVEYPKESNFDKLYLRLKDED